MMSLGVAQTRRLRRGGTERWQKSLRKNGFLLSSVILACELPQDCVTGGYLIITAFSRSDGEIHLSVQGKPAVGLLDPGEGGGNRGKKLSKNFSPKGGKNN